MVEAFQREEKNEKRRSSEKDGGMTLKGNEKCDSFVLEMESLLHVADKDLNGSQKDINGSPRITMLRSFSRKGLGRGERVGAPHRQKQEAQPPPTLPGGSGSVFVAEKSTAVPLVVTGALDTAAADGRFRRSSSIQRRSSWLDPRRVLFFFATLSSMGTLILIYFTLSLSKANGSDEALTQ